MSNEKPIACHGCGKDNHSVYFSGNIHSLSAEEIEAWLKSIEAPPFVHVNKSIDHGYGVVHCNTYEDACVFFHKMKLKKYFGPSETVMKFSEAREFRSKKLIEYREINPQSSTITSTFSSTSSISSSTSSTLIASSASMISTSSIPMTTLKPSSDQSKNDTPIPVTDLTQIPSKKQKLEIDCLECAKLNNQIDSLKSKVISLQDDLVTAQKKIIAYQDLIVESQK
ncbi:7409_t:CDS:2, partial [Rhizophagus irregularis]